MPATTSTPSTSTSETNTLLASAARTSYQSQDLEASKNFHDGRHDGQAVEAHQTSGDYLKAVIFGGLDGILTSFAIVAGSAGGHLSVETILILGFSNIFADALSMGVGEFLSSNAHNEWVLSERRREKWELENYPEGEIEEMIDIYVERGMSHDDAAVVINKMSKYPEFFIDVMMAEELQLQVPEETHRFDSMKEGLVMFISFAFFGSLPLLGYVIIPTFYPLLTDSTMFNLACLITGIVLFIMGCIKSLFSATNWFQSGMETLLLGGACASTAFCIGQYVEGLTGAKA